MGVIHLPRLPSISHRAEWGEELIDAAVSEARALEELGYDGVIVENYGDAPYPKRLEDPLSLAAIAVIVREVARSTGLKVGVNVLRNSGREAYAIAVAAGAEFVRVNALVETIVSDSGIIEPEAPLLRDLRLNYPGVAVYADFLVKHATSLSASLMAIEATTPWLSKGMGEDYVRELVADYVERGGANALVVTGLRTGEAPDLKLVRTIKRFSSVPVVVGSGTTPENVGKVLKECDGVIVGSYIKREGRAGNPLDVDRARAFIEAARRALG
ncbi:MAG: BtpA/SgcQ family protein [Desulfurococcaceae archaeon]